MSACLAGIILCSAAATPATVALALLDAAAEKAWSTPDPRGQIDHVLRTAAAVDPDRARRRVRAASDRVLQRNLAPTTRAWHGPLAALVAPHDRELRDLLLRRAAAEAHAALATAALWRAAPLPPGVRAEGDPQRSLDQEKQLLAFSARLWDAVLRSGTDRGAGLAAANLLLADARAAGYFGSCSIDKYDRMLMQELSGLDPVLLLDPGLRPGDGWGRKELAAFCGHRAYSRWLDGQRDSFTGALAAHAARNGAVTLHVVRIYKHYDPAAALAAAEGWPATNDPGSDRGSALVDVVVALAWRDPDAALAAAEREPNEGTRRELIDQVSRVWALKCPERIMRAVENQDNAVRRQWARVAADAEVDRRGAGEAPRDTRAAARRADRAAAADARLDRGVTPSNPEEVRILENPKDTAWLTGDNRRMFLRQAASLSHYGTGRLDGVDRIVGGLTDPDEADDVLCTVAEAASRYDRAGDALTLWKRVKSPHRSVNLACQIARQIGRPADDE